jgi:hypothetical protein
MPAVVLAVGTQEAVGEPLREEAEERRRLLAGAHLATPSEEPLEQVVGRWKRTVPVRVRRQVTPGVTSIGEAGPAHISGRDEWRRGRRCRRRAGPQRIRMGPLALLLADQETDLDAIRQPREQALEEGQKTQQ